MACLNFRIAIALAFLLAQASFSYAEKPNILLVSIDSLRPDHLGCYGYERNTSPCLDRLASEGLTLTSFYSVSSWTKPAHASLFTGMLPESHAVQNGKDILSDSFVTLAEALHARGYATGAVVAAPSLHSSLGFAQGFEFYDDFSAFLNSSLSNPPDGREDRDWILHNAVTSAQINNSAISWIGARDKDQPWFFFLHYWDVHGNYVPLAPYDKKFAPEYNGTADGKIYLDRYDARTPKEDIEHIKAQYDGEIGWVDEHLGRIIALLEENDELDSTAVVVVSDHGDEFFEHGGKTHGHSLYEELIRIVGIIRYPKLVAANSRIDSLAGILDLYPTLCHLAGAESAQQESFVLPLSGDGSWPRESLRFRLDNGKQDIEGFRRGKMKWIFDRTTRAQQIYDLAADPGERLNLYPREKELARQMQNGYGQSLDRATSRAINTARE